MAGQTVGNLLVRIGADISDFQKSIGKVEKSMLRFSSKMENVGRTLSTAITLPILGAGAAALKAAADYEQLEVSFQTLLKSAEKGSKFFEDLKNFAAKTPFEMKEVAAAAKIMLGYKFSADETNKQLQVLGDVAAATGGDIEGLSVIMGQGAALGKFMTVDLKQLAMRGIPILDALAAQLGVTASEVMEMASKSQISYAMVSKAVADMSKQGGPYFNAMQNQSKTLSGLFSTLKDTAVAGFAEVGMSIKETFKLDEVIVKFTDKINNLVTWFKNLSDEQRKSIVIIAAVAAAIGPLLLGIATVTKVVSTAIMGFKGLVSIVGFLASPVGLIVAGLVALAAGMIYAYNKSEKFRGVLHGLYAAASEVVKIFGEAVSAFVKGFDELGKGNFNKAGNAFTEALIKANPITAAITQGKRVAAAFSGGYEKGIEEKVESFNPFKDKDNLLAEMKATGAAAGDSFAESFAGASAEKIKKVLSNKDIVSSLSSRAVGPVVSTGEKVSPFSKDQLSFFAQAGVGIDNLTDKMKAFSAQIAKGVPEAFEKAKTGAAEFLTTISNGILNFADGFGQAITALDDVVQQFFANKAAAIDADYAKQKAAIEGSRMNEEQKQKAMQRLDEETDKKRRKLQRAQAIREKIMAIFSATINAAGAVVKALSTDPTGILAAIVASLSAVQIGLIAGAKIPALAKGGLAYGPQLAMVGDNPNSRVDPEVISPLSKLMDIFQGAGRQEVTVRGVISGRDLLLVQERAEQDRLRRRGF